nr:hypothetical protein Iba_chr13aCG10260 [Ipomoea batatas]GMD79782.1 hypothetical protein Iba_chr13dCG7260 [Ipomoea batatas]GMD81044.1 hypothetical protein Iba_chr13eCG7770 [Ipomoea batatas]GMD82579.1 hypothetical protein Iba_chr13fCG9450 [Ipomoea batatas]
MKKCSRSQLLWLQLTQQKRRKRKNHVCLFLHQRCSGGHPWTLLQRII